jgi:uncharacterized protein (TIGR02453 family)
MKRRYFTPDTLNFYRQLHKNNNREWFEANKARYESSVREPYQALITDLAAPLAKISPNFVADPRKQGGSLFRPYRDARFSKDKTPYKTAAGARFFHQRAKQVPAPSFYLHIAPDDCFIGGGIWHPEADTLKRLRAFLEENPAAWTKATHSKSFRSRYQFWGESLTRPPRGIDPAHPLIEDLKRKNLAAGAPLSEAEVLGDGLHGLIVAHFKTLAPMIDYLCAALDLEF